MYSINVMNEPGKMEKRTRGTNFSFEEKSLLLYLVAKHFDVIENKRTDSTTSRFKDQAWEKVTQEFNADVERGSERSLKQLRICYENIKRKMKRENISPFVYYSKDKPNFKKHVPILPKLEQSQEPENMLVMVNPDMVPPDPYDSSDMTTISCDDPYTPDQNSIECTSYSSTPIISIQRTSNPVRAITQQQNQPIRIVSVDSCAPSSSVPHTQHREVESSKTNSVHHRLSGITLPSGDVTVAPVPLKERIKPAKLSAAPSLSALNTDNEKDPECLRLKRKLLRRELRRTKLVRRMEMEQHLQQMQMLELEMRHKQELADLKRQVLEAKRDYYLSFKNNMNSAPSPSVEEELEQEMVEEEERQDRGEDEEEEMQQTMRSDEEETDHQEHEEEKEEQMSPGHGQPMSPLPEETRNGDTSDEEVQENEHTSGEEHNNNMSSEEH